MTHEHGNEISDAQTQRGRDLDVEMPGDAEMEVLGRFLATSDCSPANVALWRSRHPECADQILHLAADLMMAEAPNHGRSRA